MSIDAAENNARFVESHTDTSDMEPNTHESQVHQLVSSEVHRNLVRSSRSHGITAPLLEPKLKFRNGATGQHSQVRANPHDDQELPHDFCSLGPGKASRQRRPSEIDTEQDDRDETAAMIAQAVTIQRLPAKEVLVTRQVPTCIVVVPRKPRSEERPGLIRHRQGGDPAQRTTVEEQRLHGEQDRAPTKHEIDPSFDHFLPQRREVSDIPSIDSRRGRTQHASDLDNSANSPGNTNSMPRFSTALPRNRDSTLLDDSHIVHVDLLQDASHDKEKYATGTNVREPKKRDSLCLWHADGTEIVIPVSESYFEAASHLSRTEVGRRGT